ncbi:MAG: universal stress protein [Rhodospirillales bacterium]|nr:MAG: universal stress protein [Rhodospirillales bacterium]
MTYRDLFVHLDNTRHSASRAEIAVDLAHRFGAHIQAGFAECDPYLANLASKPADVMYVAAAAESRSRLEAYAREKAVQTAWSTTSVRRDSALAKAVISGTRHADLAILGQYDPEGRDSGVPQDLIEQVVVHGGRPVLAIPFAGEPREIGTRILIAWNGSREASRAVHDALPFLVEATEVVLADLSAVAGVEAGEGEPPCAAIARHLRSHGVETDTETIPVKDITAVDLLLSRVADRGIDLLVKGAHGQYGYPHLHQGASTRHILKQMTVPVLLSY